MNRYTKFTIGKYLTIAGSGILGVSLLLLVATCMGNAENKTAVICGTIAAIVVALSLIITGTVLAFRKGKEEKGRQAKYSEIPLTAISDYRTELNAVRANFSADPNPGKNKIVKTGYIGAESAQDFSVIKSGKIYYGYLVEANETLFRTSGSLTEPAAVVYSLDSYFEENPLELSYVAQMLVRYKCQNILKNERKYFFNLRVSPEMTGGQDVTGGREIYVTTLMIYRDHLPLGYLSGSLFPVIANPLTSDSIFIVDVKYWTEKLIGAFVNGNRPSIKNLKNNS